MFLAENDGVSILRIQVWRSFSSSSVAWCGLPSTTESVSLEALSGSGWPRPSLVAGQIP
ncbi:hypothetical protein GCM10022267_60410 [Lentzea roselyniae]|uniref:Uncharacterized protein n=1 Tax=Lentzea roselyniae TaxID=531940 RepID=A0ABP7BQR4_9PSEU